MRYFVLTSALTGHSFLVATDRWGVTVFPVGLFGRMPVEQLAELGCYDLVEREGEDG